MDTVTDRLLGIARRLALASAPTVQAVALTGSAATGTADESSDIDLIVLHTALPALPELDAIRAQIDGSERLYSSSVKETMRFKEGYFVDGIRCDLRARSITGGRHSALPAAARPCHRPSLSKQSRTISSRTPAKDG